LDTLSDTSDPAAFRVVNWHQQYLLPAAGVVWDSYRSSPDIDLCRDYQSREGCLRFLRNLTDNPGCGRFMPEISAVALDRRGGVCAVLIASAIGPSTGMIPQVSVRRDCQRQGLGARLLQLHFRRAAEHGLDRVALSVSSRNQGAHRLYLRLGFQVRKDFHAFIWNAC
jgi:ribosomal protein S18 acetylase RimI-like enzyme